MFSTLPRAAFLAFLVWVPIPLGSNRPIFWAINAAVCLLILIALLLRGSRRHIPSESSRLLAVLTIPAIIILLWMLVQAMPWTPSWLHNPAWDLAPEGEDWAGSISVNPSATLAAALRFVTMAIVGIIAARVAITEARAKQVLIAVLLSSTIVAGWGLLALGLDWPQAPFAATSRADVLTSFFVNRNNAAVFIGLGLVVAVALLADRAGSQRGDDSWGVALASLPERAGPYLLLILVLGVALVSTASRAGVAAGLAGMAVAFALSWRGRPRRTLVVVVAALVVLGVGLLFLGASSARLFERLGDLDFATQTRWSYYADTLRAIAAKPLTGHGAGTFADFFPLYRSATDEEGILLHAHNTYLEVAAELGVPFALLGLVVIVTIVVRCIRSGKLGPASSPAPVAAVAATAVVAIHSAFEFSLQVQAIALCLAALLGAGIFRCLFLGHKAEMPKLTACLKISVVDFDGIRVQSEFGLRDKRRGLGKMHTNQRVIATIIAGGLLTSPAWAQTIPAVDVVSANVGIACAGDVGLATVQASCLTAISGAIQVAARYGAAGNVTPQVELGFMLCQVANTQPTLREAILDLIANSGIPMLQTGCSSALQTAGGARNDAMEQCKNGGWQSLGYRNQGQCIREVNTGKPPVVTPQLAATR